MCRFHSLISILFPFTNRIKIQIYRSCILKSFLLWEVLKESFQEILWGLGSKLLIRCCLSDTHTYIDWMFSGTACGRKWKCTKWVLQCKRLIYYKNSTGSQGSFFSWKIMWDFSQWKISHKALNLTFWYIRWACLRQVIKSPNRFKLAEEKSCTADP